MTLKEQTQQLRDSVLTRMPQAIVQTFKNDIQQLKTDQLKQKALQVGDLLPNSTLLDYQGNPYQIKELITSEYLIFNFYRGGWCPYCNMELRAYQDLADTFKNIHASIVAISAESPDIASVTAHKNNITFPVLTDRDSQFMKAIGIVFTLSDAAKKDYANFGIDLQKLHGNTSFELPVPAVYVVNKELEIVFVHFEEDYMTRLEPKKLVNILKNNTK